MDIEETKKEIKSTIRKDAEKHSWRRQRIISNRRGGKFKLSESQFREEVELAWLAGEMSSAERILRCIEMDAELNNRDLMIGELHLYILDVKKELENYLGEIDLDVMDLIDGSFSTKKIQESSITQC